MTRLVKVDAATLEREYVYADPPISITQLADRHSLARSGVADKARIGKWYEKRETFRAKVSDKTTEALAEKWSELQVANYERFMKLGATYLDTFEAALAQPDFKSSARDALSVIAMMRQLHLDMERKPVSDAKQVGGGDAADIEDPAAVIAEVRRLMAGGTAEPVDD